jgi:hypothetical protein
VTDGFGEATEIYRPATGDWIPGPSMYGGRSNAGQVQLQDGRWLVAGGWEPPSRFVPNLATVEIFEE